MVWAIFFSSNVIFYWPMGSRYNFPFRCLVFSSRDFFSVSVLFSVKGLGTLHQERRGQVNPIVMEHFNSILLFKSGPVNKQHTYQSIDQSIMYRLSVSFVLFCPVPSSAESPALCWSRVWAVPSIISDFLYETYSKFYRYRTFVRLFTVEV